MFTAVFQRGGVVAVDMMNCVSLCCLMTGKDSSHQRDACNMQFYLVKFGETLSMVRDNYILILFDDVCGLKR